MSIWDAWFVFPTGGIWSNILASVIVGAIVYFWKVRRWIKKVELHHQKIAEIHQALVNDPNSSLQ